MKKHTIALLAILACFGAHATGSTPPAPASTSSATSLSGAAAVAGVRSSIRSTTVSRASGGQGGAATITGLTGVSGGTWGGAGGTVGNLTAGGLDLAGARIGSDVKVEASAPALYGATPTQPTQPCARPGFSIGGSSREGSGLLSIPTGTDVTCRVDNALTIMARSPALFTAEDRLKVSCKQEDIADTSTCKELARREAETARANAILDGKPMAPRQATASLNLLP